jgi:hypothetical protein
MKMMKHMFVLACTFFLMKGMEQPTVGPMPANDAPFSAEELQILEQKKNILNLIMILDEGEETPASQGAMSYALATALSQKAAPIIASVNLVENCCLWQLQHKELLDKVKRAIVTDYTTAIEKSKSICGQSFKFWIALVLSLIDYNDWDCFIHKDNSSFLFIPKNYIDRHAEPSSNNKMKDCGLNVDQLQKVNNPSARTISDIITAASLSNKSVNVTSLTSMLVSQKKLSPAEQSNSIQTWNIFVSGHGGNGLTKKRLKELIARGITHADEVTAKLSALPEGNENKDVYDALQKEMASVNKILVSDREALSKSENLSDEAIVPGTAAIAGIPFDDFSQLLNFFENNINTSFLHYSTCFSGGQNQTFLNDTLSKLEVSFIVSAEGLTEDTIAGSSQKFQATKENSTLVIAYRNFINFFNLLNAFFGDTSAFLSMQAAEKKLQKDPIATILSSILPFDFIIKNYPVVRIPSVGIFSAVNVDKSVKLLTNSIAKSYEFEGKMIDFQDPAIDAVVVYPAQIGVTFRIKPETRIVFPTQQKNVAARKSIHIFKKVVCKDSLPGVIASFIASNRNEYKIISSIKELECLNYQGSGLEGNKDQQLIIKNMVITITGVYKSNVNIAFMHNNKQYSYSFAIVLQQISSHHRGELRLVKYSISEELVPSKATNNYNLIAQEVGPVDTTFNVQQPGSLKKVLFMQKLSGLERALDPEQIESEKAWLAKSNKPATIFVNTLNRHKAELSGLVDQINKMPAKDLDKKDRDELLEKTALINAQIDNELALFGPAPAPQVKPVIGAPIIQPIPQIRPEIAPMPLIQPTVKPAPQKKSTQKKEPVVKAAPKKEPQAKPAAKPAVKAAPQPKTVATKPAAKSKLSAKEIAKAKEQEKKNKKAQEKKEKERKAQEKKARDQKKKK